MTDTAIQILDSAQELIQTRGYTAMSFRDIAARVQIEGNTAGAEMSQAEVTAPAPG